MSWETIKVLEFAVACECDSPATWKRKQNAWTELKWNRPQSCCPNGIYLTDAS